MAAASPTLHLLIPEEEIARKVAEAAETISRLYAGKEIAVVMVMKGAFIFAADLIRHLTVPATVDFVQASRYGQRGIKGGELALFGLQELALAGKEVLVVDDIFDKGTTLSEIVFLCREKKASSVRSVVLLLKKTKHETDYRPDIALFPVEDRFVVGYGLDYKERCRGLKGVYHL